MKSPFSKLDFFSLFLLFMAILALTVGFELYMNPQSMLNPFPPPTPVAPLHIPTGTPTQRALPPTWTPEAGNQLTSPTFRPTSTVYIETRAPVTFFTLTPLPSLTPTITNTLPVPAVPSPISKAPSAFQCAIISQSPENGVALNRQQSFQARWSLRNSGSAAWNDDDIDYRFYTGNNMNLTQVIFDLPRSVSPGETIDLTVSMTSPSAPGSYTTAYSLSLGRDVICVFSLQVNVQ